MGRSLQRRLYDNIESDPAKPILAFLDGDGRATWRTWGDVSQSATLFGGRLSALGLRAGDVCVIVQPSGELSAQLLLGALFVGAIPLLVAPPTMQGVHSDLLRVLTRVTRTTKARVVVLPDDMQPVASALAKRGNVVAICGEAELAAHEPMSFVNADPQSSDFAAYQLTSGTTGFPRICTWQQENVLAALDGMQAAMDLTTADTCFNWTPLYHDMGLVNNLLLCLATSVPLVLMSPTEFVRKPQAWLRGLSDTGATVTWSPNFGYALAAQRVRDKDLEGVRLDHVRGFWNAAERIHIDTVRRFEARFAAYGVDSAAMKMNFGCAENVGGATFTPPDAPYVVESVDERRLHELRIAEPADIDAPGSTLVVGVGVPYPGMRVSILDRNGKVLPDGHVGALALDTPSRMSGYLANATATRRAIVNGLLRTGDLAYTRGAEVFWVGRVSERINTRGKKLDPSDFERILLPIAELRTGCFAVFGVDDRERGTQRLVIAAEVRDVKSPAIGAVADDIRKKVYTEIGVTVDDVVIVPPATLTKTSSGKRRHRYFRRLYLSGELQALAIPTE